MNYTANNPKLNSFLTQPRDTDFPIQNIPFGVGRYPDGNTYVSTRIGNSIINLHALAEAGKLGDVPSEAFHQKDLNTFIALGKSVTTPVRERISELFRDSSDFQHEKALLNDCLYDIEDVEMLLPVTVGDYTDFYSSREHATNVGTMFRDPNNALLPNWLHLPVGYHGRSSSIIVTGTDIHRPKGQQIPNDATQPVFGPSKLLDFELEMAFIVGKSTELGDTISTSEAEDHIFGLALFNDWSARDIQKWEYVPLGPFLGKSFASTLSAWVITLEALEPFRVASPEQDPAVLPYLEFEGEKNYDIHLEVDIVPEEGEAKTVCHSNFKYMYWNMCQQLAHHTINGCNVNIGDLCASGTISGPTPDSYGSMLEISWRGTKPVDMPDGSQRKFIQDGDTVVMRGFAQKNGVRIGFGEVSGKILPAK